MDIVDSISKARLLDIGEVLYIQVLNSEEAVIGLRKVKAGILALENLPYTLIAYSNRDDTGTWWVCIAKVSKVNKIYVKRKSGEIVNEGDKWVTLDAQRIFQLAIKDGKPKEEVLALAVTDMERRYIEELYKTSNATHLPVEKSRRIP
jgi:hypothetical protein